MQIDQCIFKKNLQFYNKVLKDTKLAVPTPFCAQTGAHNHVWLVSFSMVQSQYFPKFV